MKKDIKNTKTEKKSSTIKLSKSYSSASFDIISIPYYLLWYLPQHVEAIADEYYAYLDENLEFILTGKEKHDI